MARKHDDDLEEDSTLPIRPGKWSKSRAVSGKLLDPTAALPGGIKSVGGDKSLATVKKSTRQLQQKAKLYMRALVTAQGDQVAALMAVYGISEFEAVENQEKLHEELMRSTHGMTTTDILKESDLDKHARIQILRSHVFHSNPAVSLKALEAINELDGASRSGGDSWESFIAIALGKK